MKFTLKSFASDNYAGVHPLIMKALDACADSHMPAYGSDAITTQATEVFKKHFGPSIEVFFVFNGTGANMLSLNTVTQSFQSIICAETAHINTDECGAIEKTLGGRLIPIASPDGKLTKKLIAPYLCGFDEQHRAQPRVISISQSSEYGTLYSVEEIAELSKLAHDHNMLLHVDGSRLANAAVALNKNLKALTADLGVDVLSFGGTKNGMMFGDAVVFFDKNLCLNAKYFRKQLGQLASKNRFIAAQFIALMENDLWRENAIQANRMAERLAEGVRFAGLKITQEVQCNVVFAELSPKVINILQNNYAFYVWNTLKNEVRWMTSFDTTSKEIDDFIASIKAALVHQR